MSVYDEQRLERRAAKRGKGDLSARRRESRQALRGTQAQASWQEATPAVLASLIAQETAKGHGVLFGRTKDGGALVLTVYAEGVAYKEYFRPSDDLDAIILQYMDDAGMLARDPPQDNAETPNEGRSEHQLTLPGI